MNFYYNMNKYESFYLFTKPEVTDFMEGLDRQEDFEGALSDYETCKGYILDNPLFEYVSNDPKRQIRTHSCFSYCANGADDNFKGDDRSECVDLPPSERDQIICLYPEDECENT